MSRRKASNSKSASRHALPASPGRAWSKRRIGWITAAVLLAVATCGGWNALCRGMASRAMATRDYETAERWLSSAVLWGGHAETCLQRARLARKMLDLAGAADWVSHGATAGLSDLRVRKERWLIAAQSGNLGAVEPALQRWLIEFDPNEGPDLCEAYVNGLLIAGRAEDAFVVLESWKLQYPQDPLPSLMEGRWLESRPRIPEARKRYERALAVHPRFAPAAYALGRLELNQNEPDRARRYFENAAAWLRANEAPRLGIARCDIKRGAIDEAITILESLNDRPDAELRRSFALVQDPDPSRPISRQLGEALAASGEFERALPHLNRALEIEPGDPTLRYLKAQALQFRGELEAAKQLFAAVATDRAAMQEADRLVDDIEQRPDEPMIDTRFHIGELFFLHDSKRRAEYWYKSVLNHDPRHAAAHARLAECYELRATDDPAVAAAAAHHRSEAKRFTSTVVPAGPAENKSGS